MDPVLILLIKDEETDFDSLSKIVVKTGKSEGTLIIARELWSAAPAREFLCPTGRRDLVFTQDPRRHIGGAGGHGGELEDPAWIFLQRDAMRCGFFDGAGDLINRGGEVAIGHFDNRFARLLYAIENLLVFNLEFGVALSFFTYDLSEGVVLITRGRCQCFAN